MNLTLSVLIAYFSWGIPQLILACMGLILMLLQMPSLIYLCYNNIVILFLISIPPFLIGLAKDYAPTEVIQASSGFSLFAIILLVYNLQSRKKRTASRHNLDLSGSAVRKIFFILTLVIYISTAISLFVYFKVGSDMLVPITGDVSSSYSVSGGQDEADRAMSAMLITTTALSFSLLHSTFHQNNTSPTELLIYRTLISIALTGNLYLSGSRGLVFTLILSLLLLLARKIVASAAKVFYKAKLTSKDIVFILLSFLILISTFFMLLPRISSVISEISALASAIGFGFANATDSADISTVSTRVGAFKEIMEGISLIPQGFGSPLNANYNSNGPKYATEIQILNYLRMGGIILMLWFIILFRQIKKYIPQPVCIIYATYIDFMLLFSMTNPLFFNFQIFFCLIMFSYLIDYVNKVDHATARDSAYYQ